MNDNFLSFFLKMYFFKLLEIGMLSKINSYESFWLLINLSKSEISPSDISIEVFANLNSFGANSKCNFGR